MRTLEEIKADQDQVLREIGLCVFNVYRWGSKMLTLATEAEIAVNEAKKVAESAPPIENQEETLKENVE